MSAEARAISYAEQQLRVHAVHDDAQAALAELVLANRDVATLAYQRRENAEEQTDREMQITSEKRAEFPDMSQAAFDRHLKFVIHTDPTMQDLRRDQRRIQYEHDLAEQNVRSVELTLKVCTARMEELSGLLHFYAATKSAAATTPTP